MLDKAAFFLKVVGHNSISAAAKATGISTSTGSRWLQELESELNTTLLLRTTRSVSLTDSGAEFFREFSMAAEQIEKMVKRMQSEETNMKGVIKVASTPLYAHRFLSKIVGEFLAIHPGVTFKIIETAEPDQLTSQVDLAIKALATYRGHLEKDSNLVKRLLLRYPLVTVCSPDYIKQHGRPDNPGQLTKHNCLYTATLVGGNHWQYEYNDEITLTTIAQTVEIENSEFVKVVAVNGGGIAYLPAPLVTKELESGALVPILTKYTKSEFEMSLYYQPKQHMPLRVQKFKDYLVTRTKELKDSAFAD